MHFSSTPYGATETFKNNLYIYLVEGSGMQKEELIQLHALLLQIKNELEKQLDGKNGAFKEYEKLGIYPYHIHKSKSAHKKAIFVLGKEIARVFSYDRFSEMGRVAQRFERLIAKV